MTTTCRSAVSDFFGALDTAVRGGWTQHVDADGTVHLERESSPGLPDVLVDVDAQGRCQVATLTVDGVSVRPFSGPDACAAAVTRLLRSHR